jgi:endonuclease
MLLRVRGGGRFWMHFVREPDAEAVESFLRSEVARLKSRGGQVCQVVGSCRVDYQGRAASTLEEGERVVMLKPDRTLLVHSARKSKPVNWMPPGANEFSVERKGDEVTLVAIRRKPTMESVRITFLEVQALLAVQVRDAKELVLRRTEGDLHRFFFEHPELIEAGLKLTRGERSTRRGPVDLWGTDNEGRRVLVEVKRSKAGIQEATQLWRYVEHHRGGGKQDASVRGFLVAPGASKEAMDMLRDHGLEFVELDWDHVLKHVETPRAGGQATLGRFEDGGQAQEVVVPERTRRTGRKQG